MATGYVSEWHHLLLKKKLLHNSIKSTIFVVGNSFNNKEKKIIIISKVFFKKEVNGFTSTQEDNLLRSYLRCTSSGVAFNNDEVMSDPMNTSIDPNFLLSHLGPTQKNFSMTRKS